MGLVAKKWLKMCDIKQEVVFAELDWTPIEKLRNHLQDDEKTLQDKQIESVMEKIINNLKKQLGAQLR